MAITKHDLWILAQTMYGEARGEESLGKVAVAHVVLNRQKYHVRWQGKSLANICKAPFQFSCWNINDPNFSKLTNVMFETLGFSECLRLAIDVLANRYSSPIGKATHYHADTIATPKWAVGKEPFIKIGHHVFYENIA